MAQAFLMKSSLQLAFHDGNDPETGKAIYKSKTFNNVKEEATTDGLYAVAQAFATLQTRPLSEVTRKDDSDIREI